MEHENSPMGNLTPELLKKQCVVLWLQRYANVFRMYGKTLADFPDRQEGFMFVLSALPLDALDAGFAVCMNSCVEFPVPQEVHAAALKWQLDRREADSAKQVIGRVERSSDFERPRSVDAGTIERLRRNSGVSKEEIAALLQQGKDRYDARTRELEQDPLWCLEQARCGVPKYKHLLTTAANVTAGLPEDPDERRSWAHDKAVKGGWIETRQPGEEG